MNLFIRQSRTKPLDSNIGRADAGYPEVIRPEKIAPALLALLTVLIYLHSISGGWVWDDVQLIAQNAIVQDTANLKEAFARNFLSLPGQKAAYYRPITTMSYMLDFLLWQHTPPGYHLTNLVLQIVICILVYVLALALLGNAWAACAAGLLFATHPTHGESVAWISGRTDLMATLFLLPSFLFYLRWIGVEDSSARRNSADADQRKATSSCQSRRGIQRNRWAWLGISAVFMFLALLSKETVAVFPALWLLFGLSKKRSLAGLAVDSVAFGLVLAAYFGLRHNVDLFYIPPDRVMPAKYRLAAAPANLLAGLRLMYLPWRGEPYHRMMVYQIIPTWQLIVQWVAFAAIVAGWLVIWRRSRMLAFFIAWSIVGAWPILNLVQIARPILAERFLYLGTIGSSLAMGLIVRYFISRGGKAAVVTGIVTALVTAGWSIGAFAGAKPWHDQISLWSRLSYLADKDPRGGHLWDYERAEYHANLGMAYFDEKRYLDALREARKAIAFQPRYPEGHLVEAMALGELGRAKESLLAYRRCLAINPRQPRALSNYGAELIRQHRYLEAVKHLKEAHRLDPTLPAALRNLGYAYAGLHRWDEACESFARAIALLPKDVVVRSDYAAALLSAGRPEEAVRQLEIVRELTRGQPEAELAERQIELIRQGKD